MSALKTVGLCALYALSISAIAAQGASAAGTTAYTCVPGVVTDGTGFSKEHCKVADKVAEKAGHPRCLKKSIRFSIVTDGRSAGARHGRNSRHR